jgi:hypothetical protein
MVETMVDFCKQLPQKVTLVIPLTFPTIHSRSSIPLHPLPTFYLSARDIHSDESIRRQGVAESASWN